MVKGCDNNCIKYSLYFLNLFFVLIGLFIIGSGIYLLVKSSTLRQIVETPDSGSIIIIVAGCAIFLISAFGCCGASKENSCLLTTYGFIVVTLSLLQIAAAITFIVYNSKLPELAKKTIDETFRKYPNLKMRNDKAALLIEQFQWTLKCCGTINGPSDWASINPNSPDLPESCCFDPFGRSPQGICRYDNTEYPPFQKPCAEAFENVFHEYIAIVAGILIAISIIQLLAGMFACMLSKAIP